MTKRIAFYTFGVMKSPVGDPEVQGFIDRAAGVYAAADGSTGFFERSIRDMKTWQHSWGPVVAPKCAPQGIILDQLAMTLSLWRDLESVAAFAYQGLHGEALSKRTDWFKKGEWPGYVAWWVDAQHRPDWNEAADRIDRLHAAGSSAEAFNFRKPFDAAGAQVRLKTGRPASP